VEIRALRESDDRSAFRSGDADLDRFLLKYAGQNQFRHHIGTTYVAIEGEHIVGYATVAAGHIEGEALAGRLRKKLPTYPLPILRLARLASDQEARGQGVGRELRRFVLELALRMSEELGCIGVVVDAKPAAVKFYQRYGFAEIEVLEGQSEARPMPATMFLPLRDIAAAKGE